MAWIQLKADTTRDRAEPLSNVLIELGAVSVTFEDPEDVPVYEPAPGETPLWAQTRIIGLFDDQFDAESLSHAWPTDLPYQLEQLEDQPWERLWMDQFQPLQFGEKLWICPSWLPEPDPDAVNILLDPGLAFGTGHHPTTALCLEWLDSADLQDRDLIDYGCGSGILAIAALKLGARYALGIDIDPQALTASRDNAQRNGIDDHRFELALPKQDPNPVTDLLVANILSGPLMELAPILAPRVKGSGQILLSGILAEQAAEVLNSYQPWFDMDEPVIRDGWVRLSGRKRG